MLYAKNIDLNNFWSEPDFLDDQENKETIIDAINNSDYKDDEEKVKPLNSEDTFSLIVYFTKDAENTYLYSNKYKKMKYIEITATDTESESESESESDEESDEDSDTDSDTDSDEDSESSEDSS